MCIAIVSPKNTPAPSETYLRNCWENNPDGAGFCYAEDGVVHIKKGFMTWDSFWKAWSEYNKTHDFDKNSALIHFRIATHGGVNPSCCHPFPLASKESKIQKTDAKSAYGIIHNGIISLTSYEATKAKLMSDTMMFIKEYLFKLSQNKHWFENDENFKLIYKLIDSKMAIMNSNGVVKMTQGFTMDTDGNYYSNSTYKYSYRSSYYNDNYYSRGGGWYSDYDDEWDNYYYHDTRSSYAYQPLMKLKNDELISFDDGTIEYNDVSLNEDENFYMTKNGDIYYGILSWDDSKVDLIYCGKGMIIDTMSRAVEFRTDKYCNPKFLIPDDNNDDTDLSDTIENVCKNTELKETGVTVYEGDKIIIEFQKGDKSALDAIKREGFTDLTPDTHTLTFKLFNKNDEIYEFTKWDFKDNGYINNIHLKKLNKGSKIIYANGDIDINDISYRINKELALKLHGFRYLEGGHSEYSTIWEKDDNYYQRSHEKEAKNYYDIIALTKIEMKENN